MANKQFIQDITVSITEGSVALEELTFRIFVLGTGASAIPSQIVTEASQLIAFGYLNTDTEVKKAQAIFSQQPRPKDIMVARKAAATAYDTALDAQRITDDKFYLVIITSTASVDLFIVEAWAGANKKFFYGLSPSPTIGAGRNQRRAAYMVHDILLTSGIASISSEGIPFLAATVAAIASDTYDLDVIVDQENSGAAYTISFALLVADTWAGIAAKIETALQAASSTSPTVTIVDGKFVFTSETTGTNSNITITDGTAGNVAFLDFIDKNITDTITVIDNPIPGQENHPEAGISGRKLANRPYQTWKWKRVNGVPAVDFNQTQLLTIRSNKTNSITEQKGVGFTNGGFTVDGSYIDITFSIDFIEDQMIVAILGVLLENEDVPLTDDGIAQQENAIRGVLDRMGGLGIIANLTDDSSDEDREKSDSGAFIYKLQMPKRSDLSANDRANRILSGITFQYTVSGSQDEVEVEGKFSA